MHFIQRKILDLVAVKPLENISVRQIGFLVGVNHPQQARHHISQLEKKGLLTYDKTNKTIKAIKPSRDEEGLLALPIYGAANCGSATHFADNFVEGYLRVSKTLLTKSSGVIIIEASGDSMNRARVNRGKSIDDGDYVVVDTTQKLPESGDYIVSIIDGMANIKKFIQDEDNQQIVLMPESSKNYPPIFIGSDELENYSICGKVIQVIKKPKQNL